MRFQEEAILIAALEEDTEEVSRRLNELLPSERQRMEQACSIIQRLLLDLEEAKPGGEGEAMSKDAIRLTWEGIQQAQHQITEFVLTMPEERFGQIIGDRTPRPAVDADLVKALMIGAAMQTENQTQAWYVTQMEALLAGMVKAER